MTFSKMINSLNLRVLLGLLFLFLSPSLKAQTYELVCPIGSRAIDLLTTTNQSTGKLRQNYCVDSLGNITQNTSIFGLTGNIFTKPAITDQTRFVANSGNDANDGLSFGTAKRTVAAACASITNQDASCTLPTGFGILYISPVYNGGYPSGFLTGAATAIDFIAPGIGQFSSTMQTANGAIINYTQESYLSLFDGGFQYAIQAGPRGKECFPITSTSVTANVLTVNVNACTQTFVATEVVYLSGTQESFLNGQKVTVSTATPTQFTASFTHANFSNATDSGVASQKNILASITANTPDLAHGTSTPASGFLLGMDTAAMLAASGHCLTGNGQDGTAFDSNITCNQSLTLPTAANSFSWKNGVNTTSITSTPATASRSAVVPDANSVMPSFLTCGTTTTCSQSNQTREIDLIGGPIAFVAGTLTITNLPFTSSTSFVCSAYDSTGINGIDVVYVSGSSVTFNGTGTDSIRYSCQGN